MTTDPPRSPIKVVVSKTEDGYHLTSLTLADDGQIIAREDCPLNPLSASELRSVMTDLRDSARKKGIPFHIEEYSE